MVAGVYLQTKDYKTKTNTVCEICCWQTVLLPCRCRFRDVQFQKTYHSIMSLHIVTKDELECSLNVAAGCFKRTPSQRLVSDTHVTQLLQLVLAD